MDASDRLARQIEFLVEIDKAKNIFRQTLVTESLRQENDAEHSWHLALAAVVLAEYAREPVDVGRVVQMALLHDIVEIDAGDVIVYDPAAREAQKARERAAAERIYALLPEDQAERLRGLWEEYEAGETPDARFAHSLDRLQSILLNTRTGGRTWRKHGIVADQVRRHNAHIAEGSPALWGYVQGLIDQAVRDGLLPEAAPSGEADAEGD